MTVLHEDDGHASGNGSSTGKMQEKNVEEVSSAFLAPSLSSYGVQGKYRPEPPLGGRDDEGVVSELSITSADETEVDEPGEGASKSDEPGHEAVGSPSSRSPESKHTTVVMVGALPPAVNASRHRAARSTGKARSPRPPAPQDAGVVMQARKARSLEHEERLARLLGGQRVPASGALGHPGDVRTRQLLVSAKYTDLRAYPLHLADVERIDAEAGRDGLTPMMAFDLAGIRAGVERDWVLLPLRVILGLLAEDE